MINRYANDDCCLSMPAVTSIVINASHMQTELLSSYVSISRRLNNYSNTSAHCLQRSRSFCKERPMATGKLSHSSTAIMFLCYLNYCIHLPTRTGRILMRSSRISFCRSGKKGGAPGYSVLSGLCFQDGCIMLVSRYRREKVKQRYIREIENRQLDQSLQPLDHDILRIEYRTMVMEAINCLSPRQKKPPFAPQQIFPRKRSPAC